MEKLTASQQASRGRAMARLQKGAGARVARAMSCGYDYHHNTDMVIHRPVLDLISKRPIYGESITSYFHEKELIIQLTKLADEKNPIMEVYLPSRKGRKVKERVNSILRRTLGYSLLEKKRGEWFIVRPGWPEDLRYTEALEIYHPDRELFHYWKDAMEDYDY